MNSKPALAADSSQPRGSAAAARVVVEPLEQRREGGIARRPRRLHRRHLLPLHHPPLPAAPSCNSRAGAGLGADARRAWSRRRGRNGSSRLAPPPAYGRRPRAPSGSGRSPIIAQLRVRGRGRLATRTVENHRVAGPRANHPRVRRKVRVEIIPRASEVQLARQTVGSRNDPCGRTDGFQRQRKR